MHPLLAGVEFENLTNGKGIRVGNVSPNALAALSGLRSGDIILSVNKRRVTDTKSLQQALSLNTNAILIQMNRNGRTLFNVIRELLLCLGCS